MMRMRINISVDENLADELKILSKINNRSLSGMVVDMVKDALELREDRVLAQLVNNMDIEGEKTISHEDFLSMNV